MMLDLSRSSAKRGMECLMSMVVNVRNPLYLLSRHGV